MALQLPLDSDGICMLCKEKPINDTTLTCSTCATPWHVPCLSVLPDTMSDALKFECPDCSGDGLTGAPLETEDSNQKQLFTMIRDIEADDSLTDREKARKRQQLMGGNSGKEEEKEEKVNDILGILGESFKCCYCMELPERPVTTPCGHNFCLKCFEKWIKQGKHTCVKCRSSIPRKMAIQPHINSTLVATIRMAKLSRSITSCGTQIVHRFLHNQDRPDKAFVSERAQKSGMSNASSGRIMVTLPSDHFGPIPAENDPERNQGVLVGETWAMRMDCRQWGVHYPPVAGIAGKANYGAQSVVISGGYEDDEDHGEWFIYTGSGGRDLSGNKRTNKDQSSDQQFKDSNEALRVSCNKGYPVRVVRSEKDKRSPYAPEKGYRYDGVYRVEKCWIKDGKQGFKVCRYLFVRCDNEPAPWTSDEHGDRPRTLPVISELREATDVTERTEKASWDYDEVDNSWKWVRAPPPSKVKVVQVNPEEREEARKVIRKAQNTSMKERLLKGFSCLICDKVMNLPLTTPCGHNFCKACLENAFAGQKHEKERVCQNGRRLRSQKNVLKCPASACPTDISEYLQNPQVNRDLMEVIEKLQSGFENDENNDKDSTVEEAEGSSLKRKTSPSSLLDESENKAKRTKTDTCESLINDDDDDSMAENNIPVEKSVVSPAAKGFGTPKGKAQLGLTKCGISANSEEEAEEVEEDGNISPLSPLQLHSKTSTS